MTATVDQRSAQIHSLPKAQQISGINFLHYLCLRSEDLRSLQNQLHELGLSSLASSESHILRQIQAFLQRLEGHFPLEKISPCDYQKGRSLISSHARKLFGTKQDPAIPYLMLTFNAAFMDNEQLVKSS